MNAVKEKKEFSKAEKKIRRKKRAKKALVIILAVIVFISAFTLVANLFSRSAMLKKAKSYKKVSYDKAQLVPQKDENGDWVFTTDRDLRVMQLTDVHLGIGYMSAISKDKQAINAVAAMITREKPDLVVVTGDLGFPVPFKAGTLNNKSPAMVFAELMESLGVYWTMTFGNHDTEAYAYYSRKDIADFYENSGYEHCIFKAGPENVDGSCNNVIKVKNSDGIITNALISLDTHAYLDDDPFGIFWHYDNVHDNQIEWYKNVIASLESENAKTAAEKGIPYDADKKVQSFLFFHIPLAEYRDAWDEFKENGHKDTENVKYIGGFKGENVCCGSGEDDLFETVVKLGSTKAMFCGHDHINNYALRYKGVVLSYGYSVDCLAYSGINKIGSQRGCTIITMSPDDTYSIDKYNYYSDRYANLDGFERETVKMQYEGMAYEPDDK